MNTSNTALARRWFEEVWNQRREDTIDELLAEGSVGHTRAGDLHSPEDFKIRIHGPFLQAFPDLKVTIDDTISEGDQVAVRWNALGTHLGDGLGMPPTGRKISITGITWIRYRDGKMIEGWDCWNQAALFEQLRQATETEAETELVVV